jgi:hypothetical protein
MNPPRNFEEFSELVRIREVPVPEAGMTRVLADFTMVAETIVSDYAGDLGLRLARQELPIRLHRILYDRTLRRLLDLRRACPDLPPEGKQILDTVIDELWTRKASTSLQNSCTSPPNAN